MKKIIFTADDLGIDPAINKGIIESFRDGVLTASALLMNTPSTKEGTELAKLHDKLQVGIHLSVVEGISLRGVESTVTDTERYFDDKICMIRHWKTFLMKYLTGRLNLNELHEELELQILEFKKHFSTVPFLNGTQHMHILPGVWKIVFGLCKKYDIEAVRLPRLQGPSVFWLNKRFPFLIPFQFFGELARKDLRKAGIRFPDDVLGMQYSGRISEERLLFILKNLPEGKTEIVMHPGYESIYLRKNLPWGYATFDWETERKALTSALVKSYLVENKIERINFSNL